MSAMSTLVCRKHPHLSWSCKSIAVNDDGRYNNSRNLFFNGKPGEQECSCHHSFLVERSVYDAETEKQHTERINHFNSLENLEMTRTHVVPTGTISSIASNQTTKGNTMQTNETAVAAALTEAGLSETSRSSFFMSEHVSRQVAWDISNLIGQVCTRVQRLAQGKGGTPDEAVPGETVKSEIRTMVAKLIWGYDHLGQYMKPLEQACAEWCGGGYSRPANKAEIEQSAKFLGMTVEQMQAADEARRRNMTDYLTIRRAGLAPVMEQKIQSMLTLNLDPIEPSDDVIASACNKAFQNRVLWGDWAGAALAKDDMVYHLGKSPEMPSKADAAEMHAKAERIREELAKKQAEQAQKDAASVMEFDALSIAA